MLDKDIEGVIGHLKGKIDHWCVTDLPLPRAATAQQLKDKLLEAGVEPEYKPDAACTIETFDTPAAALQMHRAERVRMIELWFSDLSSPSPE